MCHVQPLSLPDEKRSHLIPSQLCLRLAEHNLPGKWPSSRKLTFQGEIYYLLFRIEKGTSKKHLCFPEEKKRQRENEKERELSLN